MQAGQGSLAIVISALVVLGTTACGGFGSGATTAALEGRLVAVGGGGAIDQMNALARRFAELHPAVRFDVQNLGSDGGYSLVAAGSADLGFASRDPSDLERAKNGILEIGASGTGIAVNASNPVTSLTRGQIHDLFKGKVTRWSALGGQDIGVKLFVREPNAATRLSFDSFIFGDANATTAYPPEAVTAFSNEEMVLGVRSFAGAAGMVTVKGDVLKAPGGQAPGPRRRRGDAGERAQWQLPVPPRGVPHLPQGPRHGEGHGSRVRRLRPLDRRPKGPRGLLVSRPGRRVQIGMRH